MNDSIVFSQEQTEFLVKAAKRYIWWMTKEEAMMDPFFVISQVMNLGDLKTLQNFSAILTTKSFVRFY